jgi:DNA-binding MarR family transcriptional regulator
MMARRVRGKKRKGDTYENYRRILKMPDLSIKDIQEMRKHLSLLARTICEHVRGRSFASMETFPKVNSGIRDIRGGDWYWINKAILYRYGRKLKASGIAVYSALALFANSKSQSCFPTQRAIGELIGMSKKTVIRKIRLLEELGLIKVGKGRRNFVYQLLDLEVPKGNLIGDKNDTFQGTPGNHNNNKLTRINNNKAMQVKIKLADKREIESEMEESEYEQVKEGLSKGETFLLNFKNRASIVSSIEPANPDRAEEELTLPDANSEFERVGASKGMERLFNLLKSKGLFREYKSYEDWQKAKTKS